MCTIIVVSIEEKIREYKLQWFEYMQGHPLDTVIKRYSCHFARVLEEGVVGQKKNGLKQ